MRYTYIYIVSTLVLLLSGFISAQNDNTLYYTNKAIVPADSNKLVFSIANSNFIKNNEYFNKIVDGYTYIGYLLQPKFAYYPTSNTKLEAGVHLQKFSGKDNFTQVFPIFSFSYKPKNDLTLILGSINGNLNHKLIEPIYSFERYYDNNVESGIQFLINKKYFTADFWINWEKFILKTDKHKEEFMFGGSANIYLTNNDSDNVLYIPLQVLLAHKGGQNLGDGLPIQTIENSATGIAFEHKVKDNFITKVGTNHYFCTYNDLSNINKFKYEMGWGESSNIFINSKLVNLMIGHWYSTYFISPKGEPIFQSHSLKYDYYYEPNRYLVTAKVQFHKSIAKGIDLGIGFDYYYEYKLNNHDYSYNINLIFNRDFFLANIPVKGN